MNEYQCVEILVLMRRFKNLSLNLDGKVDELLHETVKILDVMVMNYNSINVKIVSQIFYEYSLLNFPTKAVFELLNTQLNSPEQMIYFTGYSISIIIKACAYNLARSKRNYYSDFCYKLLNPLEKHLKNFEISFLCRLFKNICFLKLNLFTTHKRLHPGFLKLKSTIQEKRELLQEKDVLCLLEGFVNAPVTLDNSLLLYLKSTILHTLNESPMNLSLQFIVKFVDLMGQQFKGMKLNSQSLEKIGREILKRLQLSREIKFSLIFDCFKAFGEKNRFLHQSLFDFLYGKLLKTDENVLNVNLAIFIIKILIPVKFNCKEFAKSLQKRILDKNFEFPIDKLLDFLYIYSHPVYENDAEIKDFCRKISNTIETLLNSEKIEISHSFLFILAREYCHIKNPFFFNFYEKAAVLLKKNWENIRKNRRFALALCFVNISKNPEFREFFFEKTANLDKESLGLLISEFLHLETKEYHSFELILRAFINNSSENRKVFLKKIMEIFVKTPPFKTINYKGNPNRNIFTLIDLINFEINIEEYGVSYTEIIKFGRFFTVLDESTWFLLPVFLHNWKKGRLIQSFEPGDLILAEIGVFIANTVVLDSDYMKIKKNNMFSMKFNENNEQFKEKIKKKKEDFVMVLKITKAIFENLKVFFDANKEVEISLSWLQKFMRIYLFLYENNVNVDKGFYQNIYVKIKENIDKRTVDNKPTIVKTMFCLIEIDILGAEFIAEQREFIRNQLQVSFSFVFSKDFVRKAIFGRYVNTDSFAASEVFTKENRG